MPTPRSTTQTDSSPSPPRLTERIVTDLLRQRHNAPGNGGAGEYAFAAQVRNNAGFDATRTFDAVALGLWPSRGHPLDVFEVKVSRSDWLSEMRKPAKAEDACKVADRFWIVAPKGCVKDGELPPTWGLIEVIGDGTDAKPWKLRVKHTAPWLDPNRRTVGPPPMDRGFVIGLLRSIPGAVPGGKQPSAAEREIRHAHDEGYRAGMVEGTKRAERDAPRVQARNAKWEKLVEALMALGVSRWDADPDTLTEAAPAIAEALRGERAVDRLDGARRALQMALKTLDDLDPKSADTVTEDP